MNKTIKIFKPTPREILKNTLSSFRIENIHIAKPSAERKLSKITKRLKK